MKPGRATKPYGEGLTAIVIDGDGAGQLTLQQLLHSAGFHVEVAGDLATARAACKQKSFDLVMIEHDLPDGNGLALLQGGYVGEACEAIIMSAKSDLDSAMAAVRLRAADYLRKPFACLDEVNARIADVIARLQRRRRAGALVRELRSQNAKLEDLVVRDGLTRLYNHEYFQQRLEAEVARSERGGHHLSLLVVDLDRFGVFNDRVGHSAGDTILKAVAAMLAGGTGRAPVAFGFREQDLAARYGGDKFALLLPETSKCGAATTAERLRTYVAAADLGLPDTRVTVSVGVASYPTDGYDRQSLLRAADVALCAAKHLGRNCVVAYDNDGLRGADAPPASPSVSKKRLMALQSSLLERAFEFVYQPIVQTQDHRLLGYEALGRPRDPMVGTIVEAIVAAERAGKMIELGRLLRELSVQPAGALAADELLFVNLHPHELCDPTLTLMDGILRQWAPRLVLEISESVAVKDYEETRRIIRELHELGFRVALDDLGAGYAGLHALAQLDADFVKLDRSLVHNIDEDPRTARLIKHILDYANSEGVAVIAEGIETAAELAALRTLGCPLVQGFLIGMPAPAFAPVAPPLGITGLVHAHEVAGGETSKYTT